MKMMFHEVRFTLLYHMSSLLPLFLARPHKGWIPRRSPSLSLLFQRFPIDTVTLCARPGVRASTSLRIGPHVRCQAEIRAAHQGDADGFDTVV